MAAKGGKYRYAIEERVRTVTHCGKEAAIHRALRGPRHCGVYLEPDAVRCPGCGDAVLPMQVFVALRGKRRIIVPARDAETAARRAKAALEDLRARTARRTAKMH